MLLDDPIDSPQSPRGRLRSMSELRRIPPRVGASRLASRLLPLPERPFISTSARGGASSSPRAKAR